MATILFPFNTPSAQFVSIESLHQAAPLVAEYIETQNIPGLQNTLDGLGLHEGNHRFAVEQFAFARSFEQPLDPAKVQRAREMVSIVDFLTTIFSVVLPSFLEGPEAATPQEKRGELFMQEVLERFPHACDRKRLIKAIADLIFED